MTKLRAGDTVIFKARVTRVADYDDDGQQIMAKILPNGEEIGWCLPKENAFYSDQMTIKVGDKVMHKTDDANTYEVLALFEDGQLAMRQVGLKSVQISHINRVRRFS